MLLSKGLSGLAAVAIAGLVCVQAWAGTPKAIAVMDFEILDDTRQYNTPEVNAAQDKRLKSITAELKQEFSERGLYDVLDNSAVSERIAAITSGQTFYNCNGCELEIGRAMNTDLIAIGWVQKVSNLILNINIEVKDTRTGAVIYGKSVDLRGNTDASWLRGIRYLVDSIVEKKQYLK